MAPKIPAASTATGCGAEYTEGAAAFLKGLPCSSSPYAALRGAEGVKHIAFMAGWSDAAQEAGHEVNFDGEIIDPA